MSNTLLVFSLVAFVGIATPGPTVLLALTNGSRYGVRASCIGMVGAMLSDFVLISAVALGLGALLAASEFWFSTVKWIGVVYLAYLGVRLLRSKGSIDVTAGTADEPAAPRGIFLRSFTVAVTNPKGYLFFTAFLPQFIDSAAPQLPQYAALAITFACIDFIVMFGYALAGAQAVKVLRARGALWLERISGGALLSSAAIAGECNASAFCWTRNAPRASAESGRCSRSALSSLLFDRYHAALHHEDRLLGRADVVEHVAFDGNDVGDLACFQRAHLGIDTEQLGAVAGAGDQRSGRLHAELSHQREFLAVHTVRRHAGIGPERDRHADLQR